MEEPLFSFFLLALTAIFMREHRFTRALGASRALMEAFPDTMLLGGTHGHHFFHRCCAIRRISCCG